MAIPWSRIKAEYLKGGTTYPKLAKKYGVNLHTLQKHASKEGWGKQRTRIGEEVGNRLRARIVRVREEQLVKLMEANEDLIDALVDMATATKRGPLQMLTDANGTLRNAESFTKAIQTAISNQRDLYRLPSMDMELRKKELAQKKKEYKEKLALEREKWDQEKLEKAKATEAASGTVWQIEEPEGEETDA